MKGTREGGGGGGEIVQVDGGLILRSTGRKDRHSKVYTSKGPRDRRVRLSAHTAIQFYDVQDRLGYDRPSKAVDWLIKKAKSAIDKLCERDTNSNPRDHQSETRSEFASSSFLVDQPDAHFVNTMRSFFPGFSSDGSVSRESFQVEDHLGLSLQTFQESFQRSDGGSWDVSGDIGHGTASFSNRELLQSNLTVNPWSQRLLSYSDHHNSQPCCSKPSDFGTPFDLGFPVQATIYGEEEADDPSSFKC